MDERDSRKKFQPAFIEKKKKSQVDHTLSQSLSVKYQERGIKKDVEEAVSRSGKKQKS